MCTDNFYLRDAHRGDTLWRVWRVWRGYTLIKGGGFMAPKLISLQEIAETWGMNYYTVRKWVFEGKIPGFKLGRRVLVRPEDVESFVEQGRIRAASGADHAA
jgi:excisionase family DNA binding protein